MCGTPAMGWVDISDNLALEILKGLFDDVSFRRFIVVKDAIPAHAMVVNTTVPPNNPAVVRITFRGEGVEPRSYTPTLQVEKCSKLTIGE